MKLYWNFLSKVKKVIGIILILTIVPIRVDAAPKKTITGCRGGSIAIYELDSSTTETDINGVYEFTGYIIDVSAVVESVGSPEPEIWVGLKLIDNPKFKEARELLAEFGWTNASPHPNFNTLRATARKKGCAMLTKFLRTEYKEGKDKGIDKCLKSADFELEGLAQVSAVDMNANRFSCKY